MNIESYEAKMRFLNSLRPEHKDHLLLRIIKGERHVPITGDEDLFYQVNKDRMNIEDFTNRDRFKAAAEATKNAKAGMFDVQHGKSKNKKLRWLGDIPAEIFFSRREFSDPMIPHEERVKAMKKWLNTYNKFRAGDSKI